MTDRFLVTGALGCIGAWTCAVLAEEGVEVAGFDLGDDHRRLRLARAEGVPVVRGDITDRAALWIGCSTSARSRTSCTWPRC